MKSIEYDYTPTVPPLSNQDKTSLFLQNRFVKTGSILLINPYIPITSGKNMGDYWVEDIVKTSVVNQTSGKRILTPSKFPE